MRDTVAFTVLEAVRVGLLEGDLRVVNEMVGVSSEVGEAVGVLALRKGESVGGLVRERVGDTVVVSEARSEGERACVTEVVRVAMEDWVFMLEMDTVVHPVGVGEREGVVDGVVEIVGVSVPGKGEREGVVEVERVTCPGDALEIKLSVAAPGVGVMVGNPPEGV